MTQLEYEQKKSECFVKFCKDNGINQKVNISIFDAFDQIFDRAYALGREKKTITQEEIEKEAKEYAEKEMENVSSWEWDSEYVQGLIEHSWYEGANFALGKQEKNGIDLKKLDEMLDDTLEKETKESLNQWLSEKNANTVTIKKDVYDKLCKYSRYVANWVPYFDVCPICGEYNQRGCICINCDNNKN